MKLKNEERIAGIKINLKTSVPYILKNIVLGFVILIYGRLIFIPFGDGIEIFRGVSVSNGVSLMMGIALSLILLSLVKHISIVSEAISVAFLAIVGSRLSTEREEQEVEFLKKVIYVFMISLVLMFSYPLLPGAVKTVASIAIYGLFLWAIVIIVSGGDIFKHRIKDLKSKIKERL